MRALRVVVTIMVTLCSVGLSCSSAALKGKKPKNAFFSGIETAGEIIHPGQSDIECGKIVLHGLIQNAQDITNDDRTKGDLTIQANAYLDRDSNYGPMWGTFVLTNPGGKWLAAWIGQRTAQGARIYAMGYGSGEYQDLLANWTYTRKGDDQRIPFNIQGFIVRKA